ncbi:hypothetical protein BACCAP_02764 [Pseudoflavonifractor capillosus ATCC 29799]|uniref:Uncharacterized protein n=1 Tax=Pseudoflavonifractor capillosus ATCC 29799 TaxID=411467 RepID=A6NX19_9FIRM|nr:hypothetical protein BACCAP_02764 [Pseudoflavonifractor capillosus ATCC 29799]
MEQKAAAPGEPARHIERYPYRCFKILHGFYRKRKEKTQKIL